ncbi:metalloregulator ArsR/SmtB family transcription factor [Flavobacteriaceae bacterium R38]|nr:metalloregulator ArsR/SmtB family transcription factor [Flavobacteriaceae bacterium R38]
MGITKSDIYNTSQNEIASIAKVIGHPARVAIIQYLIKSKSCICGDLVEEIGLAQPTISQHLKELKNIGIIKGSIEGTSVCYCIDDSQWVAYKSILQSFLNSYTPAIDSDDCC